MYVYYPLSWQVVPLSKKIHAKKKFRPMGNHASKVHYFAPIALLWNKSQPIPEAQSAILHVTGS